MTRWLHALLLLLTLLDLGFVHTTGLVTSQMMMPLWVLAVFAPLLRRLQRFRIYRISWNLGVLLLFGLLAHHAISTGLLHLLEDGLLLAALCQVHLLNNVGRRQQPDLIFFNSVLIAFVTSLFSLDGWWALLFVLHAIAFVPALQIRVQSTREAPLDPAIARIVFRNGLAHSIVVALLTVAVFAFWPRDFERDGWLHDVFAQSLGFAGELGESIELDDKGAAHLSDAVVMRIAAIAPATEVPTHWRSIAFTRYQRGTWLPQDVDERQMHTDPTWLADQAGVHRRRMTPGRGSWRVTLPGRSCRRLPVPIDACELTLEHTYGMVVDPRPDGVIGVTRRGDGRDQPLRYVIRRATTQPPNRIGRATRQRLTAVPRGRLMSIAGDLAAPLRTAAGGPEAPITAVAEHCGAWLRDNRRYQLPGRHAFAASFAEFLVGSGAGHCEYFASALALMLRHEGIPCRVVGGYLAHERDADGGVVVRARHAHAWVEVLRLDGTWLTIDPTPATDAVTDEAGPTGWLDATSQLFGETWATITGFGATDLQAVRDAIAAAPAALLRTIRERPLLGATLLAMSALCFYLRRRQRRTPQVIATLLAEIRAAGLEMQIGETPRELLRRARTGTASADQIAALTAAIRDHEFQRYRCAEVS